MLTFLGCCRTEPQPTPSSFLYSEWTDAPRSKSILCRSSGEKSLLCQGSITQCSQGFKCCGYIWGHRNIQARVTVTISPLYSNPLKTVPYLLPKVSWYISLGTDTVVLAPSHRSCSQSGLLWAPCPSCKAADLNQAPWLVPGQMASLLCREEGNFTLPLGGAHQRMVVGWQGLSGSWVTWTPKMWGLVKQRFEFAFRALWLPEHPWATFAETTSPH